MTAGKYNFTIEQNTTLSKYLTFYTDSTKTTTVDLSGIDITMQIRKRKDSVDYIDSLDNDTSGRIDDTDAATGVIILLFSDSVTSKYDFDEAYYDIVFDDTGVKTRVLEGKITLSKGVTR